MMAKTGVFTRCGRNAAVQALGVVLLVGHGFGATSGSPEAERLNDLLTRTATQTAVFLDQFSNVKCTEQVRQEKLGKDDKVELKEDSTYDYLVILTNAGGELNLSESRIPLREAKKDRKNTSMLLSNGFATLFLVFHPYYAEAFKFTVAGEEVIGGRVLQKVRFEHVPGMKSPAALALRGREYPLELSGTAWIDSQTGNITKIEAGIADSLQDVGLKALNSEIDFAPVPFSDSKQVYWFPTQARVEVETPRQHWRNLHQFTAYKKFSVSTEEQVTKK
jgi:predicted alpha/beta-hydrolase family hydrolase